MKEPSGHESCRPPRDTSRPTNSPSVQPLPWSQLSLSTRRVRRHQFENRTDFRNSLHQCLLCHLRILGLSRLLGRPRLSPPRSQRHSDFSRTFLPIGLGTATPVRPRTAHGATAPSRPPARGPVRIACQTEMVAAPSHPSTRASSTSSFPGRSSGQNKFHRDHDEQKPDQRPPNLALVAMILQLLGFREASTTVSFALGISSRRSRARCL